MRHLFTFTLIIFSITIFAQTTPHNNNLVYYASGGVSVTEIKSKPKEATGSFYYNKDWQKGSLILFSGEEIKDFNLNYDMRMRQIDIKVDDEIKTISIGAVKQIIWITNTGEIEIMKNSSLFKKTNEVGFYSIISEGAITFAKKTYLVLLESNYNTAMDTGNEAKKYVKKDKYYIITKNSISPIKKNKKKILAKFDDKAEIVKKYADENELSFKDDYDLSKIFNYYNSL